MGVFVTRRVLLLVTATALAGALQQQQQKQQQQKPRRSGGVKEESALAFAREVCRGSAAMGLAMMMAAAPGPAHAAQWTSESRFLAEVWHETDKLFYDRTFNGLDWFGERVKLVGGKYSSVEDAQKAASGMMSRLGDKYSRYLEPEAYGRLFEAATGKDAAFVAGGGVQLVDDDKEGVLVTDVEPGAPAEISGIRPGDRLVSIAGISVDDASTAARRLRGEAGSTVNVDVKSKSGTVSTVKLTRAIVELSSVRFASTPQADIVRVRSFSLETPELVSAQSSKFSKKPLVLDLRGNGGGSLDGGIGTARLFLKSGERMVTVVDKRGTPLTYDAVEDGILASRRASKSPTFVLVDEQTASAAEVLTAALKENGAATVIGSKRTFGKGVIQTYLPLGDPPGSSGAVAVTVAKYQTPSGGDVNGVGVVADVEIACDLDEAAAVCLKRL